MVVRRPLEMMLTLADDKKKVAKSAAGGQETDLGCIFVECMLLAATLDEKVNSDIVSHLSAK